MATGPLFTASRATTDKFKRDLEQAAAEYLQSLWLSNLNSSIRINTGRYISNINIRSDPDGLVLNDHRSVYGPWLEGTGSRNTPVTRFPGYASARRAVQQGQASLDPRLQNVTYRFVTEMNS